MTLRLGAVVFTFNRLGYPHNFGRLLAKHDAGFLPF